jgi:hypothetical protein
MFDLIAKSPESDRKRKKKKEKDAANPENPIIFINNLRSLTIIPLLTWSRIGHIRKKAKKRKRKNSLAKQ